MSDLATAIPGRAEAAERLAMLRAIEKKLLWLASWTIHHANHLRPSRDKLKVGGHQASCASVASIITALYFDVLRPGDRVAVKPHASPIYHAAMHLLGREPIEQLQRFRALGGAQSYPSRTKDKCGVDFSTGSVGLGAAMTLFASLTQDYVRLHGLVDDPTPPGRMVAIVGDAELDEGNIYEALLEGWKHDVRNLWWVIDYNRQSLDRVVPELLFAKIEQFFATVGWRVVTIKYGKRLQAAFARPGGEALRQWIDACPNDLYAALCFKGGAAWRAHLESDLGRNAAIRALLDGYDDEALATLMTNLGGHDLEALLEAFHGVPDDRPHCFIAYTVKGWGLPLAGHKDNHAGLMNAAQMAALQASHRVPAGQEWSDRAGLDVAAAEFEEFLEHVPFRGRVERHDAAPVAVPIELPQGRRTEAASTQEAFGRLMGELARSDLPLAARIVTTSPDVTVSTNLGGWVGRRELFSRREREDVFRAEQVLSPTPWRESRHGPTSGARHRREQPVPQPRQPRPRPRAVRGSPAPRGHALRSVHRPRSRCPYLRLLPGCPVHPGRTPSGITLAPEGGAHQSIGSPLIGISQPGLTSFEPAYADEVAVVLRWAFEHLQAEDGGSVYLRLTTRQIPQPQRSMTPELEAQVLAGGYWLLPPAAGAELAIACAGAVAPEALKALAAVREDIPGAGLLHVTSADLLESDWRRRGGESTAASLLAPLAPDAALVTVLDGHPATLSWLGAVRGHRVRALGVDRFGQSADLDDLYRIHGLDDAAILDACAAALLAA